jgi:hypothetical protein
MNRIIAFAYGSTSYVICLATFLYAIGFIGDFGVPKSLDSPAADPWTTALMIDLGLLSLFAVQHSVMARRGFKSLLTRVVSLDAGPVGPLNQQASLNEFLIPQRGVFAVGHAFLEEPKARPAPRPGAAWPISSGSRVSHHKQ